MPTLSSYAAPSSGLKKKNLRTKKGKAVRTAKALKGRKGTAIAGAVQPLEEFHMSDTTGGSSRSLQSETKTPLSAMMSTNDNSGEVCRYSSVPSGEVPGQASSEPHQDLDPWSEPFQASASDSSPNNPSPPSSLPLSPPILTPEVAPLPSSLPHPPPILTSDVDLPPSSLPHPPPILASASFNLTAQPSNIPQLATLAENLQTAQARGSTTMITQSMQPQAVVAASVPQGDEGPAQAFEGMLKSVFQSAMQQSGVPPVQQSMVLSMIPPMYGPFVQSAERFINDRIVPRLNTLENRLEGVEDRVTHVEDDVAENQNTVEERLDGLDTRADELEGGVQEVETNVQQRLDEVRDSAHPHF